jgi:hypothetical protein
MVAASSREELQRRWPVTGVRSAISSRCSRSLAPADAPPQGRNLRSRPPIPRLARRLNSLSHSFPPHLVGRFVLAEPDINRVSQEIVGRPGQMGDLGDKLRLDPMDAKRTSGDPKRVERGGGTLKGELLRANGSRRRRRSASTLTGIPVPTRPA